VLKLECATWPFMSNHFGTVVNHWSSAFLAVGSVCQKDIPSNCSGSVEISFIEVLLCFWIKINI
ncbi:hypothetical protein, partial [Weissella confusa]|uniref:hypothetical protein n=1 Tax=Weissella confusa TaxID=1583 RepID=UPI001A7E886B